MRGCALPLTKLALPCFTNPNISFFSSSFDFPISAIQSRHNSITLRSGKNHSTLKSKANAEFSSTSVSAQHREEDEEEEDEENFQVLTVIKSDYNDIVIVDSPKSRMLLLDSSRISPS